MHKILIVITTLLLASTLSAQIEFGEYKSESDFVNITSDSICFDITLYSAFITHVRGCGDYKVFDDFILINTRKFIGPKSTCQKHKSNDELINFHIIDSEKKNLVAVNIICFDSMGNMISGASTNTAGLAFLEQNTEIKVIKVNYLGSDDIEFRHEKGSDYFISLIEGNIVEDQIVAFDVELNEKKGLILDLLHIDFQPESDTLKSLKELRRQHKKFKYSKIKLIKTVANK